MHDGHTEIVTSPRRVWRKVGRSGLTEDVAPVERLPSIFVQARKIENTAMNSYTSPVALEACHIPIPFPTMHHFQKEKSFVKSEKA